MFVPESRYAESVELAKEVFEGVHISDARAGKMGDLGPLASKAQFDKVTAYIQTGIDEGARLVTGGTGYPPGFQEGYFVRPTVFADVNNNMCIAREEIFGPVLCIIPYKTEDEAVNNMCIAREEIFGPVL